jgi:hypothetical protein
LHISIKNNIIKKRNSLLWVAVDCDGLHSGLLYCVDILMVHCIDLLVVGSAKKYKIKTKQD